MQGIGAFQPDAADFAGRGESFFFKPNMCKTAICFAGGVMRHFESGFPFAYSPICVNAHAPGPFLRSCLKANRIFGFPVPLNPVARR